MTYLVTKRTFFDTMRRALHNNITDLRLIWKRVSKIKYRLAWYTLVILRFNKKNPTRKTT